jgi:hypothetical protein
MAEINPEAYAICKADMLLKGECESADHIVGGAQWSTLSHDAFPGQELTSCFPIRPEVETAFDGWTPGCNLWPSHYRQRSPFMSSTTQVQSHDSANAARPSLIDAAKGLAPVLRERAAETSRLRRLPDATWQDLMTAGILRGLQPKRWGGYEASPREFYSAISEVARAEGCAGWVGGIIGVHPWHTALYPKQTQEEVWGEDQTVMNSSSYIPTGKAERVAGGFRLSGRWSFSSGCDHCTWVNLGAIIGTYHLEGKDVPDFRSFMLPRKDYRIDDKCIRSGGGFRKVEFGTNQRAQPRVVFKTR